MDADYRNPVQQQGRFWTQYPQVRRKLLDHYGPSNYLVEFIHYLVYGIANDSFTGAQEIAIKELSESVIQSDKEYWEDYQKRIEERP